MELEHYLNLLCVEASGQAAAASLCIQTQAFPRVPAFHRLHCALIPQLWKAQSDMLPPRQSSREAKREPGG